MTRPAGPLPPTPPAQVLCGEGQPADIGPALARLIIDAPLPPIAEIAPIGESEDIFDPILGDMAGRHQPEQLPTPLDWC
jgi:hypothetical protein